MECIQLAPDIFHLRSGSNMGLVVQDDHALLIDAGLDEDAGRRALRMVDEKGARLTAILITHAHADHFGGAQFLQRRLNAPLYAPRLEAAVLKNPILEPLCLFGGAAPIADLRRKFTLAEPCEVAHVVEPGPLEIDVFQIDVVPLPGHAPNQVGVAAGEVLFCADAVFPHSAMQKHKVLFCVDLDRALATITDLRDQPYRWFAPGHGPAYTPEEIGQVCTANQDRLEDVRDEIYEALDRPRETSSLVRQVAKRFQLEITTPTAYFLTRTPVLAALSSLEAAGKVTVSTDRNRLRWRRT